MTSTEDGEEINDSGIDTTKVVNQGRGEINDKPVEVNKGDTDGEKDNEEELRENLKLFWEEYSYRHELIWGLVFKFTTAIVLMATLPYVQTALVNQFGLVILMVPVIGFFLACFGAVVMYNELTLFSLIKERYRYYQSELQPKGLHDNIYLLSLGRGSTKTPTDEEKRKEGKRARREREAEKKLSFPILVLGYFIVLAVLSFLNVAFLLGIFLFQ